MLISMLPLIPFDVHLHFLHGLGPAPSSPLGDKPKDLTVRRVEASRLSSLMADRRGFSFLRLGDMELTYLLASQEGMLPKMVVDEEISNGTAAYGNPGIGQELAPRLRQAFENANYVDFHERLWPMAQLLPRLRLKSADGQERNPDAHTSYIFLTWLEYEFTSYCRGRKIGMVGAEGPLLANLLPRKEFRNAASAYWPWEAQVYFHCIRDGGRNPGANIELIKRDLRVFVKETGVDTVFLSLGGAAKILCAELAMELGVRLVDSGAMLRALTYSGSDGNRAARSTHFPFLYRLPFSVWCDAMEQTWPDLPPPVLLAKVHAQLILEVQKKEMGWTHASFELDLSGENRTAFENAHKIYLQRYSQLFDTGAEARKERAGFLHFCGTHGLTAEGRQFMFWFKAKSLARRFDFRRLL